jgi:hypothetical protein
MHPSGRADPRGQSRLVSDANRGLFCDGVAAAYGRRRGFRTVRQARAVRPQVRRLGVIDLAWSLQRAAVGVWSVLAGSIGTGRVGCADRTLGVSGDAYERRETGRHFDVLPSSAAASHAWGVKNCSYNPKGSPLFSAVYQHNKLCGRYRTGNEFDFEDRRG